MESLIAVIAYLYPIFFGVIGDMGLTMLALPMTFAIPIIVGLSWTLSRYQSRGLFLVGLLATIGLTLFFMVGMMRYMNEDLQECKPANITILVESEVHNETTTSEGRVCRWRNVHTEEFGQWYRAGTM